MMAASPMHGPTLAALLEGVAPVPPALDRAVSALTFDSRAVTPGSVFFARRGERVDALAFAPQAARRGACAMVMQGEGAAHLDALGMLRLPVRDVNAAAGQVAHRFFGRPSEAFPVVAITGTNGKTSVAHFVAEALERHAGRPVGVLGTLGQGIAGRHRDTPLTTPDCIAVHAAMAEFAAAGAGAAVMEASSHALAQDRLAGIAVHTAVFTNLTRDHLDYHGDMAGYAAAKARLFARPDLRAAVINAADPAAVHMRRALDRGVPVLDYALDGDASLPARLVRADAAGVRLDVHAPEGIVRLESPLLGRPAAWNLLAAFAVLTVHGVPASEAARLLSRASAVPGRMQPFGGPRAGRDEPLVVVDYAHTPAALAAALETLRPLCGGRLVCVFGAGGERDPGKRPLMGEAAAGHADAIVVTDDNPRGEDGDAIVAQILDGIAIPQRPGVRVERDRARAIALAVADAHAGDVVLVAGKGHESYQETAGERRPFSDAAAVRAALAERRP